MTHPSQQHPKRTTISRASRKPHLRFRHDRSPLHRPKRWRTGPGAHFAADPEREPKTLPPHARPARAARRPVPMTPGMRVVGYQVTRRILPGRESPMRTVAGVPVGLTPAQARRVKHKTGHLLAAGALE